MATLKPKNAFWSYWVVRSWMKLSPHFCLWCCWMEKQRFWNCIKARILLPCRRGGNQNMEFSLFNFYSEFLEITFSPFFFLHLTLSPPWQKIKNKKQYLSYSQSEAPVTHLMALVVELWRARHSADFGGNAETWSDVLAHKESTVLATEWVCKHYATSVWVLSDVKIAKNGSMEVETMLLPWTEVFANEVAFELHLKEWMGVWWPENWGKYLIFGEQDSWECLED